MAKIKFNIGQGGLGRPLNGKDYYSGILFDSTTYPAGFSAIEPIKFVGSLEEAEALGIVNDGTGETVATAGAVEVTTVGAAGDVWNVTIKSLRNPAQTLAQVIESAAETTDSLAGRIAAAINAGTNSHGFTASATLAVVNLVMAPNYGAAFNAGGLEATSSGAGTATITQFSGGVGSEISPMHYHISEFFRLQPQGFLWVGVYDESAGLDNSHVEDMQNEANGDIRQFAVYLQSDFATADMGILQSMAETLQSEYKNLNFLYAADQLLDPLSGFTDLRGLTYDRVSAVCGQDGGAEGWRLVDVLGRSVSCIGAALGAVALANVSENIGWVQKFDLSGAELEVLSITNGDLVKGIATNSIELLNNKGWIFGRKYTGKGGSYFNDSPTAAPSTSDYAYIENGRTIDKAVREVNSALTDNLNAPLFVDPDSGQLSQLTISNFKNDASVPLENMTIDGDLSGYEVLIDPLQNVLSTSRIELTLKLVPVGVAREIVVNIGYTVSLTT